ncbi:hypothetical protein [Aurantimonas sp. VKM B-3413]|uniref:hypothetical protein n=1 Tax=Aurantimonas sp. VKM B-3413 TaxID=2779401 RepID=UPI001E47D5FE|nr:hypothetical protein [Aurantimonas sp. VKM B-3413]MCB8837126.1 hypothetical protein [Aurantimonas sp. VKM B-3413]
MTSTDWKFQNVNWAVQFCLEGIRTAVLINAGAGVSIVAFLGDRLDSEVATATDSSTLFYAALVYATGTFIAGLVFPVAWFAQHRYANEAHFEEQPSGKKWAIIGLSLFTLSVLLFAVGTILAGAAVL